MATGVVAPYLREDMRADELGKPWISQLHWFCLHWP